MSSWMLTPAPWLNITRVRVRLESLVLTQSLRPVAALSKNFFFHTVRSYAETPTIEAVRREPWPARGPPSSVFEDVTEEYDVAAIDATEPGKPKNLVSILYGYVANGAYREAEKLRVELEGARVLIPPNNAYSHAALYCLKRTDLTEEQKAKTFAGFWCLVPEDRQACLLQALLEKAPITLAMRFALIVASKGLADRVAATVVPLVARHAHASASIEFMESFRRTTLDAPNAHSEAQPNEQVGKWCMQAIRTHCLAGRLPAAVDLLEAARAHDVPIDDLTFGFVLNYVQLTGDERRAVAVNTLWHAASEAGAASEAVGFEGRHASGEMSADLAAAVCLDPPQRNVWVAFRKLIYKPNPTPEQFDTFINLYDLQDDVDALTYLRRIIFRVRPYHTVRGSWMTAEMRNLIRGSRYDELLALYARHFYPTGIPSFAVRTMAFQNVASDTTTPTSTAASVGRKKHHIREKRLSARYPKMWPSSKQTAMIWQWAFTRAYKRASVHHLHGELMQLAEVRVADGAATGEPSLDSARALAAAYIQPPAAPIQIDSFHFDYLIAAFFKTGWPERAANVPADMVRVGVRPSPNTFRVLIKGFAAMGDVKRAATAIKVMRSMYGTNSEDVEGKRMRQTEFQIVLRDLLETKRTRTQISIARNVRRALRHIRAGKLSGDG